MDIPPDCSWLAIGCPLVSRSVLKQPGPSWHGERLPDRWLRRKYWCFGKRCRHRLPKHQYFLRSHRSGNRSPCHDGPGCFKTDLETNGQPIANHEQSGGISTWIKSVCYFLYHKPSLIIKRLWWKMKDKRPFGKTFRACLNFAFVGCESCIEDVFL